MTATTMEPNHTLILGFYQAFNNRRLADAAGLFCPQAVLEDALPARQQKGPAGYLAFAQTWLDAFPDAALAVERIASKDGVMYEVELRAEGTHLGALDTGGCGVFKPTGVRATLQLRHLLEIRNGRLVFSCLSFDVQDVVHQLVIVDVVKLQDHLERIQQLNAKLRATAGDLVEQRMIIDRVGRELDAARRVVRPHFDR